MLQLDDKDGSRPRHLAAVGTIRRSVCCSAWSRLARGADHLQSTARTAHGPSISLLGTIRRSACCSSMTRMAHGPVISLPRVPQEVSVQQCLVEARWRWRSCRRRTWR